MELCTGILILGAVGTVMTACFSLVPGIDAPWLLFSWILGILMAELAANDMYRVLDRALELPEAGARKVIYLGYVKRYVFFGITLAIFCLSDKLNPVLYFVAYMTLKLSAYMQPLTHKLYNSFFGEKDPEPISQEEYDALHPELVPEKEKKDR